MKIFLNEISLTFFCLCLTQLTFFSVILCLTLLIFYFSLCICTRWNVNCLFNQFVFLLSYLLLFFSDLTKFNFMPQQFYFGLFQLVQNLHFPKLCYILGNHFWHFYCHLLPAVFPIKKNGVFRVLYFLSKRWT